MGKMVKAIEKNKQNVTIKKLEISIYIGNFCAQTKIMNLSPPLSTVFLVTEKLPSLRFVKN